ncbi:MAG: NAD(P)H-dependent oxidoreductase [Flavobacteriales bacterium]
MKNLIIYTHFNPNSFTKAVCDEITSVLESRNQEVKIIDLYADNYNPVLKFPEIQFDHTEGKASEDTIKYQEMITWADQLIFVFPLWWYQMPAILKGFIDRTFSHNFAYKVDENGSTGLISDKKVNIFISAGSKLEIKDFDVNVHKTIDGIFAYCDMQTKITIFKDILGTTQEVRENYLKKIKTIILKN